MIDQVLLFLKNSLNAHFAAGQKPNAPQEDLVVFPDGQQSEVLKFKLGAVSVILVNIEEENILRASDSYIRTSANGTQQTVAPAIRLNLYVLFVAHFKEYEASLRYLSLIIRYFQKHRVFNHQGAPQLSEDIEQLIIELVTLPFSEQNEIWNALRVAYHPSVLYKVKMVVFQDEDSQSGIEVGERVLRINQ